jgi:hypothetical protein
MSYAKIASNLRGLQDDCCGAGDIGPRDKPGPILYIPRENLGRTAQYDKQHGTDQHHAFQAMDQ